MRNKKIIGLIGILAVVAIGAAIVSYGGFVGNVMLTSMPSSVFGSSGQEVKYGSMVCVYHNDELVGCTENLLVDRGKNLIKDRLTNGTGVAVDFIAVGNGSRAAAPADTSLQNEITAATGCTNLARTQDTSVVKIGNGNWSYSIKFTSDCSGLIVNTTALYNHTSETTGFFAANNFTNDVTLQTNDELNVTWYVFVTES